VIHFFYLLDISDKYIRARLKSAYGEGIVNLKAVQRWTLKFRNGKAYLDDEPSPGRPRRNEKLPVIRTMIEENQYLSQKEIAQALSLCHDIMKRLITEELNLQRVNFKRVLHTLAASQNWKGSRFRGNFSGKSTNFKLTIWAMSS
jgi:hypothetical protein